MKDLIQPYLAIFLGTVTGFAGCYGLQKHLNADVTKHCKPSIQTVAYSKSGVGDVAHCVSRAQFSGPGTPLQD